MRRGPRSSGKGADTSRWAGDPPPQAGSSDLDESAAVPANAGAGRVNGSTDPAAHGDTGPGVTETGVTETGATDSDATDTRANTAALRTLRDSPDDEPGAAADDAAGEATADGAGTKDAAEAGPDGPAGPGSSQGPPGPEEPRPSRLALITGRVPRRRPGGPGRPVPAACPGRSSRR